MLFGSKSINLSEYLKAKRGISIVYFITKMMGDSGQGNLFLWFAIFFSAAFAIVFPNHLYAQMYFPGPSPPKIEKDQKEKLSFPRKSMQSSPTIEWLFHKTADNAHPDGTEQQMVWLMNRARANPSEEGIWLSTTDDARIALSRTYFDVDLQILTNEFAGYSPSPPAAFDVRLYNAAKAHCDDLISRDAQDHSGHFERIAEEGFSYTQARGNVFSYADNGVNAHGAFNIDWGSGTSDGMQVERGHRKAIMSLDGNYTNVGFAAVPESDFTSNVGPLVVTENFCSADSNVQDQYNLFVIGTVWEDMNQNDMYDPGEGKTGVTVMPDKGEFYAITSDSGGYAIPINMSETYQIQFSGSAVPNHSGSVTVNSESVLLDYKIADANSDLGDINNDDRIDLRDALIGLKVVSGDTANVANPTADVNNDGRIGLEDVLYIFRIIGEGAVHQ